jgi:hypothetical protein
VADTVTRYWYSRLVFERALALIYLVAFVAAAEQFVPLVGEHGLLPASEFIRFVPFREAPSIFYLTATDDVFRGAAWLGIALSCLVLTGLPAKHGSATAAVVWAALWVLYLSFVNVGQTFYAFGWESLLCEVGFFAIFLGGRRTVPSLSLVWIYRWTLFRLMLGAGLIKLRGDSCWRDLTCLDYYFETQPMPNPLSWYAHWMPPALHHAGVVFNHIVELAAPFSFFAPQPVAAVGGLLTVMFQTGLIVSGNLSWLNWLTIVLCVPTLDDRWFSWLPVNPPALHASGLPRRLVLGGVIVLVLALSVNPLLNLLSRGQVMNTSFNPLQLVNTYGAFGSITRTRDEIVIEGTDEDTPGPTTRWREYDFKGKPGDPSRRPPQVAPYHLRLDWLMWFAAMGDASQEPWFAPLLTKLLEGDRPTLGLLRFNPFPDRPPRYVRALLYEYHFTTPEERRRTGNWWKRELRGLYFPPATLQQPPR